MLFFYFKKIASFLTMPYIIAQYALVLGIFLVWQRRWLRFGRRLGFACLALTAALYLFFGNCAVSNLLLRSLENDYAPVPEITAGSALPPALVNCKYVVVLGAGVGFHEDRAALTRLSAYSLARLTEGIRILNMLPADAKLVVSGWDGDAGDDERARGVVSLALEYQRAAVSLGVPAERIIRFDNTRDTRDEITAAKHLAGSARAAVVTTAFHMPRVMKLCRELRLEAAPCPTDFKVTEIRTGDYFSWYIWSLGQSGVWVHETLGKLFG